MHWLASPRRLAVQAVLFLVAGTPEGLASPPSQARPVEVEHAARIVLPADSASPVNFAAQELVKYISAMGNPKPEVADAPAEADIYIGVLPDDLPAQAKQDLRDSLRGKDEDSFVIQSFGRRLVIFENSARGNLYGSYHYLETLGVRWYFPRAENECVPHRAPKFAGYKIVEAPSFHKRGIVIFWSTPGFADLVDFAAKMKLNTIGLHAIPFGPQMDDVGLAEVSRVTEPRGLTIDIERHFFGENFCPDDAASLERERTRLLTYAAKLPVSMNDFFLWTAIRFCRLAHHPATKTTRFQISLCPLRTEWRTPFGNHARARDWLFSHISTRGSLRGIKHPPKA